VCCADIDDRKVKLKVEIKPVSPSLMSADNVSDIRNLVKGLHISTATPTVHQLCFLSLASALNVLNWDRAVFKGEFMDSTPKMLEIPPPPWQVDET